MRSFGIVEFKLFESDFFLEKLQSATNMIEAEYHVSAFLSAARSVTFALQASLCDYPPFQAWYATQQNELRKSDLAGWAVRARNASQKTGERFIRMQTGSRRKGQIGFFEAPLFDPTQSPRENVVRLFMSSTAFQPPPGIDIRLKCREHLTALVRIIHGCFLAFGPVIDPQQYYTVENMNRLQKTPEDFEQELGFPSGWTSGIPEKRRIELLRREAADTEIDELFWKYLGVDRLGMPFDEPYPSATD